MMSLVCAGTKGYEGPQGYVVVEVCGDVSGLYRHLRA